MKSAIIMAAGKGTRMHSELPKVMHPVCQKPMLGHILDNLKKIQVDKIVTVVGFGHEQVEAAMRGQCEFVLQSPQLGTGHAVMQAAPVLSQAEGKTLVVNGDCPCIQSATYQGMLDALDQCGMVVLTAVLDDPKQYGRIIRNAEGMIEKIVEFKDCTEEQRKITEINTGIYCFDNQALFKHLEEIRNDNAQQEYYITDLVEIFNRHGLGVKAKIVEDSFEASGVNDKKELAQATRWMQKRINEHWMEEGVTLINPDSTYIGPDVVLGKDVTLYPNVYLEGNTVINDGTTILPQSFLVNAVIGKNCTVDSSRITDSIVHDEVKIGPYAHLRMNCEIDSKNRIGNFVEFKNTKFGFDSRCAHLTYLGDSEIGSKVNIGCGVITVNYDGKNKVHTVVKDGAFIGSNVNLIAPVTVGENAVVAAGSTATQDVPDGDMAIGRVRQENKPGYGLIYKNKEKK